MASFCSPKTNSSLGEFPGLLHLLVSLQAEYELPSIEDIQKLKEFPLGHSEDDYTHQFLYMMEITKLNIPLICNFTNSVPFVKYIPEEYKRSLVKASLGELLILKTARRYDHKTDSIVFANNQPYTRQNFQRGDYMDSLFEFCQTMWNLQVDNGQYALLTVIVTLSKRPFLIKEEAMVWWLRKIYIHVLRDYFDSRSTSDEKSFDQWLHSILEKLLHLGLKRSEFIFSILVKYKGLRPHIQNFWDLILCYPRYQWDTQRPLSKEEFNYVCKLVLQLDKYPSQEDIKKVTPFALGDSEEDAIKRNQHMTDMTDLTAKRIVEFAKGIPEFSTLSLDDRTILIKASISEVMVLWAASRYHPGTNSIVFPNDQPYTKENFSSALMGTFADCVLYFCRTMYDLKANSGEYALLTAIVIFSVRPNLREPKKVAKLRELFSKILQRHIVTHRTDSDDYFRSFLFSRLFVLEKLGSINLEQYIGLKARNENFPLFLGELLN